MKTLSAARLRRVGLAILALIAASAATAQAPPPAAAEERLRMLFETYFEELLQRDAVFASEIGDSRYNDRLANFLSEEFRVEERRFRERWLSALRQIDRQALEGQDRRSYDIFILEQEKALGELRFPRHLLPVSQLFSIPSLFAQLGSGEGDHPFRTEKDYRDFLARIDAWLPLSDQVVANLREGVRRGVVQPAVLMERALPQLASHLVEDPTESVFYQPLVERPEEIGASQFEELRQAYREAIVRKIVPSYRKIFEVVRDEILPASRESIGLSALPDGAAWYAHDVWVRTTTRQTPEEIHELGLSEVARIRSEMSAVQREMGFEGDLGSFFDALESDARYKVLDQEATLDLYRVLRRRVERTLPRLFDVTLDAPFEILRMPEFYAASAPAAIYNPGAADGSRPGIFYVNTVDLESRPVYRSEALFLHEALPGHHLQSVVARQAGELPRFRRFISVHAYQEGWALYSESLGSDLGLYQEPAMRFGRLEMEMLRALRLVVDTGIHAHGWSRQQAIDYMRSNSSISSREIASEVERYIAWPGQALSYKIGELTLHRLRREAEQRLGDRFDLRAFHRAVLEDGVLPLSVLERKIDEWIADRAAE